jgi:hypothetical protein
VFIGGLDRDSSMFGSGLAYVRMNVSPHAYCLTYILTVRSSSTVGILFSFWVSASKTVRYGLVDKPNALTSDVVGNGSDVIFGIRIISKSDRRM